MSNSRSNQKKPVWLGKTYPNHSVASVHFRITRRSKARHAFFLLGQRSPIVALSSPNYWRRFRTEATGQIRRSIGGNGRGASIPPDTQQISGSGPISLELRMWAPCLIPRSWPDKRSHLERRTMMPVPSYRIKASIQPIADLASLGKSRSFHRPTRTQRPALGPINTLLILPLSEPSR